MNICEGGRIYTHAEVVYEGGDCPVCEAIDAKREVEKQAEEAEVECGVLREQVEEVKAQLESYQTDLREAVRGVREAVEVINGEEL